MHTLLPEKNMFMLMKQLFMFSMNQTKKTTKFYMQVYVNIKETKHLIRIFVYKPTYASYNTKLYLMGFSGKIITDAYTSYNNLKEISNGYCCSHCIRKFCVSIPKNIHCAITLFKEAQNECKPELLEGVSYQRRKKKYKDPLKQKLFSNFV